MRVPDGCVGKGSEFLKENPLGSKWGRVISMGVEGWGTNGPRWRGIVQDLQIVFWKVDAVAP